MSDARAAGGEDSSARRALWPYALASAVALVGLGDSIYLTAHHYSGQSVRCAVVTGCNEVLGSEYATLFGVPVAVFGAFAYFTAFSLATLSAFGYRQTRAPLALLAALMLSASLWLLYLQAFVIRQFCIYCLLSAATSLTLALIVALGKLWRSD